MQTTSYKGQDISREDVLDAMRRFDDKGRSSFPASRWKTYAIQHNGKLYPPKETIRLIVGRRAIGAGGEPVNSRFRELGFEIVTLAEPPDDNPEASAEEAAETSLSLVRDLEENLAANLSGLENPSYRWGGHSCPPDFNPNYACFFKDPFQ